MNPVPLALKAVVAELIKEDKDKILSFVDLHAHSTRKSIFLFGPYYPLHSDKYFKIRVLPKLISERTEMFRFYSCRFRHDMYKEHSARMTI